MEELENICRTMLDNADLKVEYLENPFSINLIFYVVGMDRKVIFHCSKIEEFNIVKDALDEPLYICLEVKIEKPREKRPENMSDSDFNIVDKTEYLWNIEIPSDPYIKIRCLNFYWEVLPMTDEEIELKNK